ncbi:MAG: DUF2867 domain-containing protein [Candidatus Azobacteroides sp.]|nr:DUF2867 domain-containing protein [Candidatus Azobacteroides sp.]
MKVKNTKVPEDSLTSRYTPADYVDCFTTEVCNQLPVTPDEMIIRFWTHHPAWVTFLFKLRNKLIKLVGLKEEEKDQEAFISHIREGKSSGGMLVTDKSENETVMCLDATHLKAYLSVYLRKKDNQTNFLSVITVVHIKNRQGKIYFTAIAPFHRIIVKRTIKYIINSFYLKSKKR